MSQNDCTEQMLAIVSHDIKNPITAIQLEAQLILKLLEKNNGENFLSEEIKLQASRIIKTTDRLKSIIEDLLDKNKTQDSLTQLNKKECDLSRICMEAYDSNLAIIREKEITIKTDFTSDIFVSIDKSKVYQVITNLLSNAIKFSPHAGTIKLSIGDREDDILLRVSDEGPGLKPTEQQHLFEKYWTGNVHGISGTGLGLFICKSIVEAHGGKIGVKNLEQCGSEFWFSLPKLKERKILVIDDDEDLREVISWALKNEGFSVHTYGDPQSALTSLKLGRHNPMLMVVDFQMDGMNGTEFLKNKNLIELDMVRNCPAVMMSASSEDLIADENAHLCKAVFAKPLDLTGLIDSIKKYAH